MLKIMFHLFCNFQYSISKPWNNIITTILGYCRQDTHVYQITWLVDDSDIHFSHKNSKIMYET